jgi:hypothetical protein
VAAGSNPPDGVITKVPPGSRHIRYPDSPAIWKRTVGTEQVLGNSVLSQQVPEVAEDLHRRLV